MPVTCTNYKLKCGGCPLLNQPYPDQLKHKQQLEQRLLGRFAPVSPVLGQAEPWHYRNKAIATFATGPRGRLTCGIYAAGTHRVLPYTDCLLQDTVINQTIAAVLEAAFMQRALTACCRIRTACCRIPSLTRPLPLCWKRHLCSGHSPRAAVYGLLAAGYRH